MAQLLKLNDNQIVNVDAISFIEDNGAKGIKIHFIGRMDNVIAVKGKLAAEALKKLGVS